MLMRFLNENRGKAYLRDKQRNKLMWLMHSHVYKELFYSHHPLHLYSTQFTCLRSVSKAPTRTLEENARASPVVFTPPEAASRPRTS
jgi:hypothetical protein